MRFRQCMTRGMSLIKLYVVNTLRSTLNDIREKIAARVISSAPHIPAFLQVVDHAVGTGLYGTPQSEHAIIVVLCEIQNPRTEIEVPDRGDRGEM